MLTSSFQNLKNNRNLYKLNQNSIISFILEQSIFPKKKNSKFAKIDKNLQKHTKDNTKYRNSPVFRIILERFFLSHLDCLLFTPSPPRRFPFLSFFSPSIRVLSQIFKLKNFESEIISFQWSTLMFFGA